MCRARTSSSSSFNYAIFIQAGIYVLSGVTQPLLMSLAKDAGLANPKCQLYMLFYYIGPACVILTFCQQSNNKQVTATTATATFNEVSSSGSTAVPWKTIVKIIGIATVDIIAQTMNYTGSTMAGPTIFAIIYSSVTVWCAILSRLILHRRMSCLQWIGVLMVFGGLTITAIGSASLGPKVYHGAALVTAGSALHALMYVLSESVMKTTDMVPMKYCAIFGCVGCAFYFTWQMMYTRTHLAELVLQPMAEADTSYGYAVGILVSIAIMSLVHSLTFFFTVKHFPGGATSAGVMKALQAVLVFVATSIVFCGRLGGAEMCFTIAKCISLVVVVVGVLVFGKATDVINKGEVAVLQGGNGYKRVDSFGDANDVDLGLDGATKEIEI
mmetsp:Transcript_22347/g.32478  ORF Transcript_22347/g.32478 Transcript_22347/m.32478 type:complete len:384 (+) Transcript_22347:99-1250(+)